MKRIPKVRTKVCLIPAILELLAVTVPVCGVMYLGLGLSPLQYKGLCLWLISVALLVTLICTLLRIKWITPLENCLLALERKEKPSPLLLQRAISSAFSTPMYISLLWVVYFFVVLNSVGILAPRLLPLPRNASWWLFFCSIAGCPGFWGTFYCVSRALVNPGLRVVSLETEKAKIEVLPRRKRDIFSTQLAVITLLGFAVLVYISTNVYFKQIEGFIPERMMDSGVQLTSFLAERLEERLIEEKPTLDEINKAINEVEFAGEKIDFLADAKGAGIIWPPEKQLLPANLGEFKGYLLRGIEAQQPGALYVNVQRMVFAYSPILGGRYAIGKKINIAPQQKSLPLFWVLVASGGWCIFVFALLSYYLSSNIVRPLGEIDSSLQQMAVAKGDLTQRVAVTSEDEVGVLSTRFNQFLKA